MVSARIVAVVVATSFAALLFAFAPRDLTSATATATACPLNGPLTVPAPAFVRLSAGRVFECRGTNDATTCLERALEAALDEGATWRRRAAALSCKENGIGPTGGFCVTKEVLAVGGNNYMDSGVVKHFCDVAGRNASVLDLGCGVGHYAGPLRACGLTWRGYDGADNIEEATGGRVAFADVTAPLHLDTADWVVALEVGEHLPEAFAETFLDNIARHAKRGALLSWAVPGQDGHHHVNNRPNSWVVERMAARGFRLDEATSTAMRGASQLPWMKNTAMLFVQP